MTYEVRLTSALSVANLWGQQEVRPNGTLKTLLNNPVVAYASACWVSDLALLALVCREEAIHPLAVIVLLLSPILLPIRYCYYLIDRVFGPFRDSPSNLEILLSLGVFLVVFAGLRIPAYVHQVRSRRREQGLCVKCAYDLQGSPGACPECGHAMEPAK